MSTRLDTLSHVAILKIAVPVMISNVSTALIGVVDTGVVGQLPDPAYIGAIAVGSLIFTFVFWAFGFLRMGTSGLTAQALGANDFAEIIASLYRALLIALSIGLLLIAFSRPIGFVAFELIAATARVESLATTYFDIRIWAAPATLANYALLGWFIGLGRTDIGLVLQLFLNIANIVLDVIFVLVLEWDVTGVATGTLVAEYGAAGVGVAFALKHIAQFRERPMMAIVLERARLRRTLLVNADIMIRSVALIFVFLWFVSRGARSGDVILAANAVLMHFISVSAYFLDGLAFATEALVGRASGAADRLGLFSVFRRTTAWAAGIAAIITLLLVQFGPSLIDFLTIDSRVRATAREYLPWAAVSPLLGVWAFQLDGAFIGATRTREMRNAMLASTAVFVGAWWLLQAYDNHGLWAALIINYCARIVTLGAYFPRLLPSENVVTR